VFKGVNGNQAWVTCALCDEDVGKALTLCFSLKKTLSSRKVGVIVSSKVTAPMKEALHLGFDHLFYLDEDWNTAGLKSGEYAKVFTLTLKAFDKCVFLEPTMLAMKNSDEVFENFGVGKDGETLQAFLWVEKGDYSVFGVRPDHTVFKTLMRGLKTKNGTSKLKENLLKWTKS